MSRFYIHISPLILAILAFLIPLSAAPAADTREVLPAPAPAPEDSLMLIELAEWVGGGPDEPILSGEQLRRWIRERAISFDFFRTYHPAERHDRRLAELPFAALIATASQRHDLDPFLVAAVILAESSFDPNAVSAVGALGLMQVMPKTAALELPELLFVPEINIDIGSAYLRQLMDRYEDRLDLALAAYNAGPAAVRRFHGVPPYRETQRFVERVLRSYVGYHRQVWAAQPEGALLAQL